MTTRIFVLLGVLVFFCFFFSFFKSLRVRLRAYCHLFAELSGRGARSCAKRAPPAIFKRSMRSLARAEDGFLNTEKKRKRIIKKETCVNSAATFGSVPSALLSVYLSPVLCLAGCVFSTAKQRTGRTLKLKSLDLKDGAKETLESVCNLMMDAFWVDWSQVRVFCVVAW